MDGLNNEMKGKMMDVRIEGAMTNGWMDRWMKKWRDKTEGGVNFS